MTEFIPSANKNGGTDEDEDDDSEDEDVELTGDADEDASSTEDSEDTADDDEEDEDEDEAIRGLRLGVPSALKDQDDSEPGVDSGTTACVALLLPYNGIVKLFVANAGDSRAVLCRGTVAIDLSVDHKPEDEDEKSRITAAGGTVTRDGRVNGGLNLSRALGDHSYKQAQGLPLAVQMITPSPDVTQFDLIPGSDQFLVIACDGVWNSMTSQEVVDFVRERLQSKLDTKGDERLTPTSDRESDAITLSKICEEDHVFTEDPATDSTWPPPQLHPAHHSTPGDLSVRADREAWWTRKTKEMEDASNAGNVSKLFHLIRSTGPRKPLVSEVIRDKNGSLICSKAKRLDRWAQYFEQQFNWPSATSNPVTWPSTDRWTVNMESPSVSEVSECISLPKRHRALVQPMYNHELHICK
ncbi:hypothetical protein T265_10930 [Opisthorchis viverrini]|uniref:protein-serine/threonine phosphatase n=1 Tax=Opisthorchis viverrini TaxID=6198 RepID=A0A074Z0Q8_OPIVI|nr:hypothetical protein T265_10930 [Opisthorchis viverrini]KER20543.1 hypothetical protein T265_10930 [Opisthorchis viverrini]